MTTAKSAVNVASFFDLDQFYREIAIDFLTATTDHFTSGHYVYKCSNYVYNYYIYKRNDQWIYLSHDFDLDLGIDGTKISMKLEDYKSYVMLNKLIIKDDRRFVEILKEIVDKAFNPATLFPSY